jgi:hypothetical protein
MKTSVPCIKNFESLCALYWFSVSFDALVYNWLHQRKTRDVCCSFFQCIFYVALVGFGPMRTEIKFTYSFVSQLCFTSSDAVQLTVSAGGGYHLFEAHWCFSRLWFTTQEWLKNTSSARGTSGEKVSNLFLFFFCICLPLFLYFKPLLCAHYFHGFYIFVIHSKLAIWQ